MLGAPGIRGSAEANAPAVAVSDGRYQNIAHGAGKRRLASLILSPLARKTVCAQKPFRPTRHEGKPRQFNVKTKNRMPRCIALLD